MNINIAMKNKNVMMINDGYVIYKLAMKIEINGETKEFGMDAWARVGWVDGSEGLNGLMAEESGWSCLDEDGQSRGYPTVEPYDDDDDVVVLTSDADNLIIEPFGGATAAQLAEELEEKLEKHDRYFDEPHAADVMYDLPEMFAHGDLKIGAGDWKGCGNCIAWDDGDDVEFMPWPEAADVEKIVSTIMGKLEEQVADDVLAAMGLN